MIHAGNTIVRWVGIVALAVLAVSWVTRPAVAQVSCGDTITGKAQMTASLVCDSDSPALTIDGGSLDMNGYGISGCFADGIHLVGKGSSVSNGRVEGCTRGFVAANSGKHKLTNVVAVGNTGTGIRINPSAEKTKLVNVHAIGNGADGVQIQADGVSVAGSSAVGNGDDGFAIEGEKVKFKDCVADGNGEQGFDGQLSVRGSYKGCSSSGNGFSGFAVAVTDKLKNCTATGNGGNGFFGGDKVSGSTAVGNGQDGFVTPGRSLSKSAAGGNRAAGV